MATHRVHGMGTELEAPAWPAITADEATAALARFPAAGRLESVRWHSPRPFSAAALVQTAHGTFVLKRHDARVRSTAGLAEEHAFIAHLARVGMAVPELIIAGDATGAVALGDWTYELQRQSAGTDLYRDRMSWTPFLSPDHAHAAGVALARLHQASQAFDAPARQAQPLVASFTILPSVDPLAAAEAYVAARPALGSYLDSRPWQRQLASLFAPSHGLAGRLATQPPLWTHNDWHPSNLLWADDGAVRTVFDFGLADRTCALNDLATAIERAAIEWLKLAQGDDIADPQAALSLLAGYAGILPLTDADIDLLVRLLPLVHVEFALSEVDYFAGILADTAAADLAWDGYLVGHAEWFLTVPGRDLLARIRGR